LISFTTMLAPAATGTPNPLLAASIGSNMPMTIRPEVAGRGEPSADAHPASAAAAVTDAMAAAVILRRLRDEVRCTPAAADAT
jgi:hypothetical protein